MKRVAIIGAGGFGREVLQLLLDCKTSGSFLEPVGFVDDDTSKKGSEIGGLPILGPVDQALGKDNPHGIDAILLGIGSPLAKRAVVSKIGTRYAFPSLVHPSVIVGSRVHIGEGVLLTAGNIVTVDVKIENFAMINLSCTVGHDAIIGQYTVMNPGINLSGGTSIGEGAFIGTGATILEGRTIGSWSTIGAGAVVNKDIPSNSVAVGVPARVIKTIDTPH